MINSMGFIGGGRITRIFLMGFKNKNFKTKIVVSDVNLKILESLSENFDIKITNDNKEPLKCDVVFFALHKKDMLKEMELLKDFMNKEAIIISLAPGTKVDDIKDKTGLNKIIRMIPNVCSAINKGFNPVYYSESIEKQEKEQFKKIADLLGESPEVKEDLLEAYAVISAMGPKYFWFQWLKLKEIAEKFGLSREQSNKAIYNMLNGAVEILFNSDIKAEEVLNLIPVNPLMDKQNIIEEILSERMQTIFQKLK